MGRFSRSRTIFRDESILTDQYMPDGIIGRESEMKDYEVALQPVINGAQPRNIFVYGETGVGKTVATKIILEDLMNDQQEFDDIEIDYLSINCKDLNSYDAAINLVNQLKDPDETISSTGYSRAYVHDQLWQEVEQLDATHLLFVLDEVDSFGTDDELLYQIPRANANGKVKSTQVGLIGISNDFTFRNNLSARVQSTLCEQEIHFAPYDANQLRAILQDRAEKAFADGALEKEVVPYIAAKVGQDSGSARAALDILYKAASIAFRKDADTVTETHARRGAEQAEQEIVERELEKLPKQTHLILYAVLILEKQGKTPASRPDIYELYKKIALHLDIQPKTSRTIHDRLQQLNLKGVLTAEQVSEGVGGPRFEYRFDVEKQAVEEVLTATHGLQDLMNL